METRSRTEEPLCRQSEGKRFEAGSACAHGSHGRAPKRLEHHAPILPYPPQQRPRHGGAEPQDSSPGLGTRTLLQASSPRAGNCQPTGWVKCQVSYLHEHLLWARKTFLFPKATSHAALASASLQPRAPALSKVRLNSQRRLSQHKQLFSSSLLGNCKCVSPGCH